jgi:indole-3-glycerol phosphate synthase
MSVLDEILAAKRSEIDALRRDRGEASLRAELRSAPPTRDFGAALRSGESPRVIAEFKRRSPSKDSIRAGADPAEIAAAYASAGAAALSVLTDGPYFGGSLDDLRAARAACELPVLRKDFNLDAIQLIEARSAGADAILLIVSALDDALLRDLHTTAAELDLAALVEVHDERELERAQAAGAELIGINNRDLNTFKTDVALTRALLPRIDGALVVSESGIDSAEVVRELEGCGASAFLVGEALLRQPNPGQALRELRGKS